MNKILLFLFSILFSISVVSVSASVQTFSTDKSLYHNGDIIHISGKVTYDSSIPSVIVQIITPDGTGLAHIANIIPQNDGTFSKSIHAGGPTWSQEGKYTIKISYGGNFEKTIDFTESRTTDSTNPPSTKTQSLKSSVVKPSSNVVSNFNDIPPITQYDTEFIENPKMRLLGYPSLDYSPQYYIDRYNNEPEYRFWFDSQFPEYTVEQVVGYASTHIDNFPSIEKSPQYYIDRYNNEPEYRFWFDSQFPEQNIYDVLGFSTYIPDWIKTYAKYWATGDLSDQEFMVGLDFMMNNNIIVIQHLDYSENNSVDEIPFWFRNTAQWWANDLISQQEFINSIKYLIQKDIILVE